jgi:predicted RNA-binding protein associated with RNAse of E/G family
MSDEQLDIVVKRSIHRGRIWSAHPQLVLDDSSDELVTLGVPGTPAKVPSNKHEMAAVRQSFESGVWELEDKVWKQFIAVVRNRPGRYFNVMHLFDPSTGEFLSWYVNFERPIVRHDDGLVVDTLNLWLDLIVLPDGKTFWKNTDHWNWASENGLFSSSEVSTVERLREELLAHAAAGSGPFNGSWTEWAPIHLEPLTLPDYWDRPSLVVDAREVFDHS